MTWFVSLWKEKPYLIKAHDEPNPASWENVAALPRNAGKKFFFENGYSSPSLETSLNREPGAGSGRCCWSWKQRHRQGLGGALGLRGLGQTRLGALVTACWSWGSNLQWELYGKFLQEHVTEEAPLLMATYYSETLNGRFASSATILDPSVWLSSLYNTQGHEDLQRILAVYPTPVLPSYLVSTVNV